MLIKKHTNQSNEKFTYAISTVDAVIYHDGQIVANILLPSAIDRKYKNEIIENIIFCLSEAYGVNEPLAESEVLA